MWHWILLVDTVEVNSIRDIYNIGQTFDLIGYCLTPGFAQDIISDKHNQTLKIHNFITTIRFLIVMTLQGDKLEPLQHKYYRADKLAYPS